MSEARLEEILAEILPPSSQIFLSETCSEFLGASVVLFSDASEVSENVFLDHEIDGLWTRYSSLAEFADKDDASYRGAGVSATILDGKDCLRSITSDADEMLFGTKSGLYFRSENRQVVAIVFDEPEGHGVMFLQAP